MLESGIVAHCAPTLAGIKTANMFNYLPDDMDMENPYYRTINADLTHGIPPTYLCCGDMDPLLDDSRLLNQVLSSHGIRTQLDIVPGVLHAFMHYGCMMDEAVTCLRNSGTFFKSVLEG